jgi:DNA topoisomerase I
LKLILRFIKIKKLIFMYVLHFIFFILLMDNLVIVESPAKSQTIKKFLWNGFEVKASFGHTVDLPSKELWIDINNNFEPKYIVSPDKKKVISELKSLASKAKKIWIATDEDREWEAIWRHIANQLKLDISKTSRIVFHEITKSAIENAIKNPRNINMNLVNAQQARRVLDRLVWFELSPILRQKIKTWLSAGRVQSVAVRVIVEREREIQSFQSKSNFKVTAEFQTTDKQNIKAELSKKLKDEKEVQSFLDNLIWAKYIVKNIETKPWKKSPSAPFTTSTLQQEASRKFGMPVARTMQLAQKLYESWHITYMRTDSLNLSETAIQSAQQEITKFYGKEYSKPTKYTTKSKSAQEAHECIRPTHFENHTAWDDPQQKRLYELIWKRTVASQMSPAELEKTKITIESWPNKYDFIAQWEVIKFDGFLKLYLESKDDEDEESTEWILPKVKKWENLWLNQLLATETFDKYPPRYTEASH